MLVPENENDLTIEKEKLEKINFYIRNSKSENTQKVTQLIGRILANGAKK